MNKYIKKDVGINAINSYKRASNIQKKLKKKSLKNGPDVVLLER